MSEITTQNKILDTAERLFAVKGFAGTSLRAIIKEAGVNTASVHYHFGSKEGLIEAVLQRRAAPVNAARLEVLDRLEVDKPSGALPLEAVIAAFITPAIEKHFRSSGRGQLLPKLFGRAIADPDERLRAIIRDIFGEVFRRFTIAFMRALPGLSQEEVQWRMHFMIGTMVFTVTVPKVHEEQRRLPMDDRKQID
jgi:AcrR family transcriptional regulator